MTDAELQAEMAAWAAQSTVNLDRCVIYRTCGLNFSPVDALAQASPLECLKLRNDPELLRRVCEEILAENPWPKRDGLSDDDFGDAVFRWLWRVANLRNERFRQLVETREDKGGPTITVVRNEGAGALTGDGNLIWHGTDPITMTDYAAVFGEIQGDGE